MQVIRSFLYDLPGRWKQFFKQMLFFRWKTILAIFSSYYRAWQTSSNIFLGSIRYYGNHCASYKIISVKPKWLLKTQISEKIGYFSTEKYMSANLFSYYRVLKTSSNNLQGSRRYCHSFCESYKIISLGPTRSIKTISQKKSIFPRKNNFGHFFLVLPIMADLK